MHLVRPSSRLIGAHPSRRAIPPRLRTAPCAMPNPRAAVGPGSVDTVYHTPLAESIAGGAVVVLPSVTEDAALIR